MRPILRQAQDEVGVFASTMNGDGEWPSILILSLSKDDRSSFSRDLRGDRQYARLISTSSTPGLPVKMHAPNFAG
jgi:hypothetical protein